MCIRFADLERKLGEIDRARAVYMHASQMADPRVCNISYIFHALPSLVTLRRCGLMVSALDSGSICPGSSPGWGHCVVFLDKKLSLEINAGR